MANGGGISKKKVVTLSCLLLVILLVLGITLALVLHHQTTPAELLQHFPKAAITTDAAECAAVGKDILLRDGSAVDSAIATLLCMGVVTPQSMGLGGGFLMTIYNRQNETVDILDAKDMAPGSATKDMFGDDGKAAVIGGKAIAVPGELHGMYTAYKRYGRLPWSTLFEHAINISRDGFHVGNHLANAIRVIEKDLTKYETLREFLINNETKQTYKEGEMMRNPTLSRTLQAIALNGTESFYKEEIARALSIEVRQAGGNISVEDLRKYESRWLRPIQSQVANFTMYSCPPPGSGAILAFMLRILEGFRMQPKSSDTTLFYHRAIETFKFAYAKRMEMEDSDSPELQELVQKLLSSEFADSARNNISDERTFDDPAYYGVKEWGNGDIDGTAHMAVIAANGDAVSVTSSINSYFGSKVRSKSTGIVFNNAMNDFSLPGIVSYYGVKPTRANQIAPYKRPFSSMAPSIFLDRDHRVKLAIGGNGGTQITSGIALVVSRILMLKENIRKAIDSPRVHDQLLNNTKYEKIMPKVIVEELKNLGHYMDPIPKIGSVILGIVRGNDQQLYPYSDPRKGGKADGF